MNSRLEFHQVAITRNKTDGILPKHIIKIGIPKMSLYELWVQYFFKPNYKVKPKTVGSHAVSPKNRDIKGMQNK